MGSPLTFWKLQQVPVYWALDRAGFPGLADDPEGHQVVLLPLVRSASLWIWAAALVLTAAWARRQHGPRAMALAAWLFALSPNLLAHGALVTMEMPLVACSAGIFLLFHRFLETGDRRAFFATAALAGLAFSCKFTAVLFPPLLGLAWWIESLRRESRGTMMIRMTIRVAGGMLLFLFVMLLSDLIVTGFATLPVSTQRGGHPYLVRHFGPRFGPVLARLSERPLPQDWVGFLRQMQHQRGGGPSYLLGERRMNGWWYYYFVCLAVKVPLAFYVLLLGRAWLGRRRPSTTGDRMILAIVGGMLVVVALGSSRNYGFRYLLPLAPAAIVWVSALAEWGRRGALVAMIGLLGQALAVMLIHPHELSYFNAVAGGTDGGRVILADSNLDWGQGAKFLAELQRREPFYRDLTLYYFGDTDPRHYGVVGEVFVIDAGEDHPGLPPRLTARTRYLAVSTSLEHGPWGPPHYFDALGHVKPAVILDGGTILLYRTADISEESIRRSP